MPCLCRGSKVLLAALVALGCAGGPPDAALECLKLTAPDESLTVAKPAKLSLFFSVETCGGQPVAGLQGEAFTIYENGTPISAYESRKTIQPKGQRFRMYTMVLLDLSGSVLSSGAFPQLREAAATFVDRVLSRDPESQRIAIYAFDGRQDVEEVVGFTADALALKQGLAKLELQQCQRNADCAGFADRRTCSGWRCVDDSTNLNGAVVLGLGRLEGQGELEPEIPFRKSALVLFTDGTDQAARVSERAAKEAVRASLSHVVTVGLGGEVDASVLTALGKDGYYSAARPEQLTSAFDQVAARLSALAHRFYLFEYCSPKRSGTHQLEIIAAATIDEQPLRGSLRTTFDATGFESGCEVTPVQP
jgi:hypothetical protein